MAYAFGATSLSRSQHVDPLLMEVFALALSYSSVDFGFTEEQSRTAAEQQHKVDTGVSKVPPGPKARHMRQKADDKSKAGDLVPWVDGRFQWGDDQWRIYPAAGGEPIYAFHEIALAVRRASIELGRKVRWGAVWDRDLADLPGDLAGMRKAVEDYKARHAGSDFLDGPHFEFPL
jgi:hypothetical protein